MLRFCRQVFGGRWALFDIFELLFEIALRGAQPDDPHRSRLRLKPHVVLGAFNIISHKIAQQLRTGPVIGARSLGELTF